MMHEKRCNHLLLMVSLIAVISIGLASSHAEASGKTTSLFIKSLEMLKSSGFATLSLGPVWKNAGNTQTFYLAPNIEKTYTANHASHALVNGEIFLGIQKPLPEKLEGQLSRASEQTLNSGLSLSHLYTNGLLFKLTYHA